MKYVYIDSKELKGKLDYTDMLLFFGIVLLIFLFIKYFGVSGIIKWILYLISAFFIMLLIDCLTIHRISYCRSCDEAFDFDINECPLCGKKLEQISKNYVKDIREEAAQEKKEMVDSTAHTKSSSSPQKTSVHKIKRKKGIDGLIEALKDDNWNTRRNAVYALGSIGDKCAVELLIDSLNDNHKYVRRSAAITLGKLNDARAVDPLTQLINDNDTKTRENAVIALGKLGNKKAIDALIMAYYDEAPSVRVEAENALFHFDISMKKPPPKVHPHVKKKVNEKRVSKSFNENDNIGTRHDTWDKAVRYWMARTVQQKFDPFVLYIFNDKADACDALIELDCIHVAKDTDELICTETLIFGYYLTGDGDYEAVICGEELTHNLWVKAKESFEKHGGRRKNDQEPEKSVIFESKKIQKPSELVFVREYTEKKIVYGEQNNEVTLTYRIYKASNTASAKAFLKENPVNRSMYYVIVETPEGNWGRDIDGIYKE